MNCNFGHIDLTPTVLSSPVIGYARAEWSQKNRSEGLF